MTTQTTMGEPSSSYISTSFSSTMDLSREDELPYTERLTFGEHVKLWLLAIIMTIAAYLLAQELLK